jgi:flagellar export protein FliJ
MSRTPHRLRRLLDLRRRQEEAARIQLAQSMAKAAELSEEVRQRTEALESVLSGSQPSARRSHLDALVEMTAPATLAARAAEASAMSTVVEIRREWSRAAVRLKGLERLEENDLAAAEAKDAREAARQTDDAIVGRIGRPPT